MRAFYRQRIVVSCAILFTLTFLAYSQALSAGFIWDDDTNLLTKKLETLSDLKAIWFSPHSFYHQYYPLTHTSFWVDYQIWEFHPFGYHLMNVLIHAVNAILLWWLMRMLGIKGAWWIAALFALHPVYVESVAWITERKNLLSGFFYLLSMMAFVNSTGLSRLKAKEKSKYQLDYFCSILFFLLAMFSKTAICTLPVILLVLVWWKRGTISLRDFKKTVPFFMIALCLGGMTWFLERNQIGGKWDFTWPERFLIAGRAFWFYPRKIIWPDEFIFVYPRWAIDVSAWRQYLFPMAAFLAVVILWKLKSRLGRGPLAAVLFYTVTLLPAIGIVDHYMMRFSFVADHLQYWPSIGILILVVSIARKGIFVFHLNRYKRIVGIVVIAALWLMTFRQARIYANNEVLYKDTIQKNSLAMMGEII